MKLREDPAAAEIYFRHFPRKPGTIAGEFTPSYILPPGPALLRSAAPNARIVVMLRDPIDRLESAITMDARRRRVFTLEIINAQERRSRYTELLEYLFRYYPPERVLVLQYEQCVADTPGELARTHRFLGIDPEFVPPRYDRPVNKTTSAKRRLSESERAELVERLWPDLCRLPRLVPGLDLELWRTSMALAPRVSG